MFCLYFSFFFFILSLTLTHETIYLLIVVILATSMSLRSDPGIQKLVNRSTQNPHPRHFPSSLPIPPYSPQIHHNGHVNHDDDDDDSDGPDIIITRL